MAFYPPQPYPIRFLFVGSAFAYGFLQVPPQDGHACLVDNGLSPPSHPTTTMHVGKTLAKALRAVPDAQKKAVPHRRNSFALNIKLRYFKFML